MKKNIFTVCGFALIFASFISCRSTQVQGDLYDNDSEAVPIKVGGTKISSKQNERQKETDPYSDEKIRGEKGFVQQLFNTEKYEKIENSSLFTKSLIGNMSEKKISLIHKPGTDMAGFLVRFDTSLYTFYMAEKDRNAFINAVDKYLFDFESKALERKGGRKTESVYGNALCFQEFGIVEAMMNNYSKPKVAFGYSFAEGSPYFTLTVKPSKNLNENIGPNDVQQNIEQKYYFNKEQVTRLAEFMSSESVNSLGDFL